jgi:hypothetical protein
MSQRYPLSARPGATLVEVLVITVVLVIGLWGTMEVFGPGMRLKRHAASEHMATRFAESEQARLGELPMALVARKATVLTLGLDATEIGTMQVVEARGFQPAGVVLIDGERIQYASVTDNVFPLPDTLNGLTRGLNGSVAAVHPKGAQVSTDLVDSSISSSSSPNSWDYLYKVHTVIGERIETSPYVYLRFGPGVRSTQLAYFPRPYQPDQTFADLANPSSPTAVVGPPDIKPAEDCWTYNRYYYVDEDGGGTPDATYLTFDEYFINVHDNTNNEPRWLLLNYSYVDDATGQVNDVVGAQYQLSPPPNPYTTLSAPVLPADTTMSVADASAFPSAGVVMVDQEVVSYASHTNTTLDGLTRGKSGTTAVGHAAISRVLLVSPSTTLTADLLMADATMTVADASAFPSAGVVLIDQELISYAGHTNTTLDGLTRGVNGTVAADHALDSQVQVVLTSPPPTIKLRYADVGGKIIPGSESVFRVVGTSLRTPMSMALPYVDDDPTTPLVDESTPEGPGIFAFDFRAQKQTRNQVALPLPGETLLANYDFPGHKGLLDVSLTTAPSYQDVYLPEIICEDHFVPNKSPYEIRLNYKPLDGDSALTDSCFEKYENPPGSGNWYSLPVTVMAVVKDAPQTFVVTLPGSPPVIVAQSGRLCPDLTAKYQDRTGPDASAQDIDQVDGANGILRFAPEIGGKWVRVYYRALDRYISNVVKSAAEYAIYTPGDFDTGTPAPEPSIGLPAIWDADATPPQWKTLYRDSSISRVMATPRQFWLAPAIDPATNTQIRGAFTVPPGTQFYQGAEVAVDYAYDGTKRIGGETHKIEPLPPDKGGGYGFTLNHPNVTAITSIRGASATVRVAQRSTMAFNKLKSFDLHTQAVWRGSEGG